MSTNRGVPPQYSTQFNLLGSSVWKSLLMEFALRSAPILLAFLMEKVSRVVDDPAVPVTRGDVEIFKTQVHSVLE